MCVRERGRKQERNVCGCVCVGVVGKDYMCDVVEGWREELKEIGYREEEEDMVIRRCTGY